MLVKLKNKKMLSLFIVLAFCASLVWAAGLAFAYSSNYSTMNVRGTNNNWGTTAMTLVANNTWQVTATFGSTTTERFKFDASNNWATNWGDNNRDGIADSNGSDIPITGGAGTYTITFNDSTKAYTVVKGGDTTAPTVSLTAPTAGTTLTGSATVTASASDNVGVSKVEFYAGTSLIGTDTTSPYSISWSTTTVANGTYSLTAKAYDAAGNTKTSTAVSVTVNNDKTAPTVSLTAPASGATLTGSATVTASASDNVGVSKVEFYAGTSLIGTDTTSPYSISWSTTTVANGTYSLTAKAYDAAGNNTVSAAVSVTVNNPITGLTVHFKRPSTWGTTLKIHYWNVVPSSIAQTTWPGNTMIAEGNDWYKYTISSATSSNVVFNDGNGHQTVNLTRNKEGWYYTDNTWYDVNPEKPKVPVITATPDPALYLTSKTITLTGSNSDDKIYYTLNGTTPTTASTLYTGSFIISTTTTIKAFGVNSLGEAGTVASFTYTIDPNADMEKPTITSNIPEGYVASGTSVIFTIKDNKTAITKAYYTTDGSNPTTSSTLYVSGNASAGLAGSAIPITKTITFNFLVVDGAGNQTTQTFNFYYGTPPKRSDFREDTIYFLMTARFYDGDPSNDRYTRADAKSGNRANNDPPWRGDFKGLIQKLDYIKALGFSAIWITPPVLNRSDYDFHGYHAWDFTQIDKRLESPGATYQDLINAAHTKGIKIIQDIVLNHSCRYGVKDFMPVRYWGDSKDPQWGDGTTMDYYDVENKNFTYNGLDVEPISGKSWYNGDLWQKDKPTLSWNPNLSAWGTATQNRSPEGYTVWNFQWPNLTLFDPAKYHQGWLQNWEDETCQTGTIHEDCPDLDTESTVVQDYLINAYNKYITMGVDGFRIDTVKHVSRNTFNRRFIPAFKAKGGDNFFMFGEVCTRVNEIWNHGVAPLSTPFYTWKERQTYSTDDHTAAHESYVYENGQGVGNQPTSNNAFLDGNTYRTPDYSKNSGMAVIDFPMHWNFSNASSAFNIRGGDQYYNDATWNVVYVDSHDYGPNTDNRYAGSTDDWAENIDLMFTFRGIPCLYYGSEIEFQKGARADIGPTGPLATTGRAYFGDKIEGSVQVQDYGVWSNATGAMATTLNNPLAKHIARVNRIRRAIPALQKGEYSTDNISGSMAYKKRFTDAAKGIDSFVLVTISGGATFNGIPNGKYVDAITGNIQNVTNGTLTANCSGRANMRIYVLDLAGNPAPGKIGEDTQWLK